MNKRTRLDAYISLLERLFDDLDKEERYRQGLCEHLIDVNINYNIGVFPELIKHKPKKKDMWGNYWFKRDKRGTKKRIRIVIKAIQNML